MHISEFEHFSIASSVISSVRVLAKYIESDHQEDVDLEQVGTQSNQAAGLKSETG